jgi:hypothetical protein
MTVALLSFADSLRERRDLVARHPDRSPAHKRPGLKLWLSVVGAKRPRGRAHLVNGTASLPIVQTRQCMSFLWGLGQFYRSG